MCLVPPLLARQVGLVFSLSPENAWKLRAARKRALCSSAIQIPLWQEVLCGEVGLKSAAQEKEQLQASRLVDQG